MVKIRRVHESATGADVIHRDDVLCENSDRKGFNKRVDAVVSLIDNDSKRKNSSPTDFQGKSKPPKLALL